MLTKTRIGILTFSGIESIRTWVMSGNEAYCLIKDIPYFSDYFSTLPSSFDKDKVFLEFKGNESGLHPKANSRLFGYPIKITLPDTSCTSTDLYIDLDFLVRCALHPLSYSPVQADKNVADIYEQTIVYVAQSIRSKIRDMEVKQ